MPAPHVSLDPLQSWRFVGTSAMTRAREGTPRWCLLRTALQPPYFTLCRSQRTVRPEALMLAVRPELICRICLIEAMRRGDFPLRRELLTIYHQTQGVTTP